MRYVFVQSRRLHNARVRLSDPLYEFYNWLDFFTGYSRCRGIGIHSVFIDEGII